MATVFDTNGIVFSNDDLVVDPAPISPSADIDEIRQYVGYLDSWRRVREQLAAGGVLAKMVTFRDLVKYGLLDLSSAGIFDPPETDSAAAGIELLVSCSDLTSDLEPNPYAAYFRAPSAFTLTGVRASLLNASTSGAVSITMTINGSAALSTALSIDATEKTSATAATPAVISVSSVPADAEVVIEIVSAGTEARGLVVGLIGTPV